MQQLAQEDVCPVCPAARKAGKKCASSRTAGWTTLVCILASGLPQGVFVVHGQAEQRVREM